MSIAAPLQPTVPSLGEIIRSAINLARICLGMDVAFITEFKDGYRIFRHIVGKDALLPVKVGDSDPLEESYCQYIINGQIPAVVDDSHIYPILKVLKATDAMKIRAHLGVPIRLSDGSVFGTFCCYSRNPDSSLRESTLQPCRTLPACWPTSWKIACSCNASSKRRRTG